MSSGYIERYLLAGTEADWGTPQSTYAVYWGLALDATVTENRIEEDIIAVSRQARSRIYTTREIVGSLEWNPLGARGFQYALGQVINDAAAPYTIEIGGTLGLPSFSILRGMRSDADTVQVHYAGCKCDRLELLIEEGEDIVMTMDFVGYNTVPVATDFDSNKPTGAWGYNPPSYFDSCLIWGDNTLDLRRVRLEVNNNLTARYAGICTGGLNLPVAIREGAQEVTGEFRVDTDILQYVDFMTSHPVAEGTIKILFGTDYMGTVEVLIEQVAIDEWADSMRGRDEYELDIPFVARASGPSNYDAIRVKHGTGGYNKGTIEDIYW